MYTTIEAIYDNGKIILTDNKVEVKRSKVLITFLDSEESNINKKSTLGNLLKYKSKIKSFPKDSVTYQRELRDAW